MDKRRIVNRCVAAATALLTIGSIFFPQLPANAAKMPMPAGYGKANGPVGKWKSMPFDDEFSGSNLNRKNWSTGWLGSGITAPVQSQETACYDPKQVSVSGGVLRLKAANPGPSHQETCGGKKRPYISGAVNSNAQFKSTYGFYEASIWLDVDAAGKVYNWPAWWMRDYPYTSEIDIMEGLSGNATATLHQGGQDQLGREERIGRGWHTFGVDWEPGKVTAYYDGKKIGEGPFSSSKKLMLILGEQLSLQGKWGGKVKVPSEMNISYVRVWSHS